MKRVYYILCVLLLHGMSVYAQTLEEIERQILEYQKCFNKQSAPNEHDNTYKLSDNKSIPVIEQTDFSMAKFVSMDKNLENVNLMLMDRRDLTKWEVRSAKKIMKEYFQQPNTFHIAAHGLVDQEGASTQTIKMGGQILTAQETADLILQTLQNYNIILDVKEVPFSVVLHSCKSGMGTNSFAHQLSVILSTKIKNVAVIAAPDLIMATLDENGKYGEAIVSSPKNKRPSSWKKWKVFKDGKDYMEGTNDYKTTVDKFVDYEKHLSFSSFRVRSLALLYIH